MTKRFQCAFPNCHSRSGSKRNNIERHVWTQHIRQNVTEKYIAAEHKPYVDKFVRMVWIENYVPNSACPSPGQTPDSTPLATPNHSPNPSPTHSPHNSPVMRPMVYRHHLDVPPMERNIYLEQQQQHIYQQMQQQQQHLSQQQQHHHLSRQQSHHHQQAQPLETHRVPYQSEYGYDYNLADDNEGFEEEVELEYGRNDNLGNYNHSFNCDSDCNYTCNQQHPQHLNYNEYYNRGFTYPVHHHSPPNTTYIHSTKEEGNFWRPFQTSR